MTLDEGEAVALLNCVCLVGAWWTRDPNRLEAKCLTPSSASWEIGKSVSTCMCPLHSCKGTTVDTENHVLEIPPQWWSITAQSMEGCWLVCACGELPRRWEGGGSCLTTGLFSIVICTLAMGISVIFVNGICHIGKQQQMAKWENREGKQCGGCMQRLKHSTV